MSENQYDVDQLTKKERIQLTSIAAAGALATTTAMSAAAISVPLLLSTLQLNQSIIHWGQTGAIAAALGGVAVGAAHLNQKLGQRAIEVVAGEKIWDRLSKTSVGRGLIDLHRKMGPIGTKVGMVAATGITGFAAFKGGNAFEALATSVVVATPFVLANALNARKKFTILLNQRRLAEQANQANPQMAPEPIGPKRATM